MPRCKSPLLLILICLTTTSRGQQPEPAAPARDDARQAEIESFFESIDLAFGSGPADVLELFSGDHFVASAVERGLLDREQARTQDGLTEQLTRALQQAAEIWYDSFTSDAHDILKLEFRDDDSAEVFVRHWDDNLEVYAKYRWWLVDTGDGWKFFDVEDVEYNMRASALLGSIHQASRDNQPWVRELTALVSAMLQDADDEGTDLVESIQDEVDQLLDRTIPDGLRAWVLSYKILWLLDQDGRTEDALDYIDEMEDLNGEYPAVWYLRGHALGDLEEYQAALDAFGLYAKRFGWDADICEYVSDTYFWMDNPARAAEFAEKGLADNPRSWGCLASLAVSLPADQKSKLDSHLGNLEHDEAAMEYVMDWAIELEDLDAARHVYQLLIRHHPDSELIGYYQEILDQ